MKDLRRIIETLDDCDVAVFEGCDLKLLETRDAAIAKFTGESGTKKGKRQGRWDLFIALRAEGFLSGKKKPNDDALIKALNDALVESIPQQPEAPAATPEVELDSEVVPTAEQVASGE